MAQYAATVRDVAEGLGVVLVDHADAWSRVAKEAGDDIAPDGWLDDAVHPGPRGHRAMVRTLLEVLDLADPTSAVYALGDDVKVSPRA